MCVLELNFSSKTVKT